MRAPTMPWHDRLEEEFGSYQAQTAEVRDLDEQRRCSSNVCHTYTQ